MHTRKAQFSTAEVAKLAGASLRQIQLWEESRVVLASRTGRARVFSRSQALFVIVIAEFRKRGLSFQRIRELSDALRHLLTNGVAGRDPSRGAFILSDGRKVQFADSPNKTLELVSNFSRPIVCVDLAACLDRLEKTALTE